VFGQIHTKTLTLRRRGISWGVARATSFSQVLWLLTATWVTGCGRIGFDLNDPPPPVGELPDAPVVAPDSPVGPAVTVTAMPSITTACGSAPQMFMITLANTGDQELIIDSVTVDTTSPTQGKVFSAPAAQFPLQIAPGATGTLQVIPPRAVVGTDRGNTTKSGMLTLHTNAAVAPAPIALDALIVGANLDITMPISANLTFRSTDGSCPAPQTVKVQNTGTSGVAIQRLTAAGIAVDSGFSGGTIAKNQTVTTSFRPFTASQCAISGVLSYDVSSGVAGLCTSPAVLNVTLDIQGSSSSCFCS
jgi:hypothetical protein